MQSLQQRLAEVMAAMGWEHADVMRVSGQSSSVVSQWLGKSSKIIKTIGRIEAAQALADASGYSALWIAKGILPKRSKLALAQPLESAPVSQYVTNVTAAKQWGELMTREIQPEWPAEVIVVVPDGALEPHVLRGDHLTFIACTSAEPTSVVVIEQDDGTRWIRRLVLRPDGKQWGVSTRPDAFPDLPVVRILARATHRASPFSGF